MVKILMRADTHVNINVSGNEPRAKCTWSQVMASLSVSLGSMVVGFASAYTSPALVSMSETNSTITINDQEKSWIGSLMPLGALIGAWLLIALANGVPMIYAGRAIAGFCVGIASLCLPVYLGETVQPEVRGTLGLLPTTLGNVGILLGFVAGKYLDWKALAFLGATIPVPFLICMFLIPETPRWFISKNNHKKARIALQWLRGKDADIEDELSAIERTHMESEKNAGTLLDLLTKNNLKPLAISIGLMFFQQLSGINAVIFYTVQIFQDAGSTIDKNLCTIIVGVVNFGSTFIATILIDRLGRKILLYISAAAMTVALAALGTFFYLKDNKYDVTEFGWLPLASFVIFVIGFSLGYGPVPWLMMGEILPAKIRGPAASLVTAFNWSCTFVVTKTFTDVIVYLGTYGTFWLFGSICFSSLLFVFIWVPETQGRSLEDIERNLTGAVRRMSSIANLKPSPMAV
ncbi:unnamed protein product [Timema podura]|uniref:Major facilitator superfamily (MFS) profile domain-containing protein n=1 Tax=Timema podura TaxID=61482 RepID=A0ABN7NGF3_TIMPD|nr:unnamed protein product [Timema podura]